MLVLQGYEHDKEMSLKDFLYNFFRYYNNAYNTHYTEGGFQTGKSRGRSLGDIHEICQTYYGEDLSREEVKETLLDFKEKLVGHYCGDIEKRIYSHVDATPGWMQCHSNDWEDEYGDKIIYRHSLEEILEEEEIEVK